MLIMKNTVGSKLYGDDNDDGDGDDDDDEFWLNFMAASSPIKGENLTKMVPNLHLFLLTRYDQPLSPSPSHSVASCCNRNLSSCIAAVRFIPRTL
jgi:hypothetical protein